MKKTIYVLNIFLIIFLFTACGKNTSSIILGNLSFKYDTKVWKMLEKSDESTSIELRDSNDNIINIYTSTESTYQHPMTMISFIEDILSSSEDFQVFQEPNEITVNGNKWYEYGYIYTVGSTTYKVYQRYYGKYYTAASVSYTSIIDNFYAGYDEAIKLMSQIKVNEEVNNENEKKAKEFLVGEWDLNKEGYLIFSEDGTYEWYSDKSKNKNNMHYGTYGCDVENPSLSLNEGDGIYLVLLPEALIINGKYESAIQFKNDFIMYFTEVENNGYSMVNIATYSLYTMYKQ